MVHDVILRDRIAYSPETARRLEALYGSVVYAHGKRQLSSREIRRLRDKLEPIEKLENATAPLDRM
jgi:hypothetical protein